MHLTSLYPQCFDVWLFTSLTKRTWLTCKVGASKSGIILVAVMIGIESEKQNLSNPPSMLLLIEGIQGF